MVKIILGNARCKLIGLTDSKIIKEIDLELSYQIVGYQFMGHGNWDGRYRLFDKGGNFPIGLLGRIERILIKHDIKYTIQDNREKVIHGDELEITSAFSPRDYQLDAVDKAYTSGGGIIRAATGAGKTLMIAMLAAKYNVKTIIYVIGKELLYQMKETVEKAYGVECGIVGDGQCKIVPGINICTVWTAASAFDKKATIIDNDTTSDNTKLTQKNKEAIKNLVTSAKLIMIDECQYAASDTIQFLHRVSESAKYRFLWSGTPWRDTGDDILIESVGGPKIFDIGATELINRKVLVTPKIHFIDVPLKRGVGKTYQEVYTNYIVENEERNERIISATKKLVAAGRKVLILITKREHGKKLLSMLEDNLRVASLDGKNKTEDRLSAIKAMKEGRLDVLVASKIFDQGVDIPELDALILAGSGKSSSRALQRIGRVIRTGPPNKKDAIVVDFLDNCKYLRDHSQIRFKVYSMESGFKIKMPDKK
jgi:superfamily II DNA or RNA helicase